MKQVIQLLSEYQPEGSETLNWDAELYTTICRFLANEYPQLEGSFSFTEGLVRRLVSETACEPKYMIGLLRRATAQDGTVVLPYVVCSKCGARLDSIMITSDDKHFSSLCANCNKYGIGVKNVEELPTTTL